MRILRLCLLLSLMMILGLQSVITTTGNNLGIDSWGYQLQNYDLETLKNTEYKLLVLDYSKDGSDQQKFTTAELESIKSNGIKILSYISIGEAEDYRYYFNDSWKSNPPTWIDGENPDWKGNYKVKYWEEAWQEIIHGYLDKIANQGFDGVYLDIIDAYEFYQDTYSNARQDMIDFVLNIANYTRASINNFLIFPQNGEELLENQTYAATISGIGKEDLFIQPDEQKIRASDELTNLYSYLDILIKLDKPVLTVDYSSDPELISIARQKASDKGYIEYIGTLELDRLLSSDYQGSWLRNDIVDITGGIILVLVVIIVSYRLYKKRQ